VLWARPLHSHLVREWPKIVSKLYEQFAKFSKSEVQHFHKLEMQRKTSNPDEAPRSSHYNDSSSNNHRLVQSINLDGCGPPEN
jgi:hypothetical protein